MLTSSLLAAIAGLAALDSLNPATVAGVTLILLAPSRRPGATALAYVAGAYLTVLVVGTGLFLGADAVGGAVEGASTWIRRGALSLAALVLAVSGVRRLRTRERKAVVLPRWFGPWTAAPVGVLVTGADLPNAFPYLVAIERLTAADVPAGSGLVVLALYSLVYCVPCLLLLLAGTIWRQRLTPRLQRVYARFGGARTVRRSIPAAAVNLLLAAAVASLAVTL
ncbi:hypothetical protein GTR02_07540 [Kineococcus sp. R8]|uniref:GAP family protein n=1 Tax=Kineococcus siccus TaxID=2696567 RepID=UPI001412E63C|nr:hypothetical protein [Kineococcus siccus]